MKKSSIYTMKRSARERFVPYLLLGGLLAFFLVSWQRVGVLKALIYGRPSLVAQAFSHWFSNPYLRAQIPVTLKEAGISFVVAMAVAIALASLLTYSKVAAALAAPYITIWNAVPKILLAPIFIFIFGLGLPARIYFVSCAIFITPFFAIYRGLTTVDVTMLHHAKIIGANRRQLIRDVYFPSCVGTTLAVLRIVTQFCLVYTILAEVFTSSSHGMGLMFGGGSPPAGSAFLLASVLLVALMGFVLDRVVRLLERRFLKWRVMT